MRYRHLNSDPSQRRGIVLLAVLVVVAVLTLAAYRFSEAMLAEAQAAESYTRSLQARGLSESGVHYVAAMLVARLTDPESTTLSGTNLFDDPRTFQVVVQDNTQPRLRGLFSIVAPPSPDSGTQNIRYGLVDETGKINLAALMKLDSSGQIAHDVLMKLPNASEEIVNAILDWIDADEEPRTNGAEDEYYSLLTPSYRTKNAPLDSLEELLFIKGVTPQLLYGSDRNRNGLLDADEVESGGQEDPGWLAYLTIYSRELNVDSTGQPRIYVNDSDLTTLLDKLTTALGEDLANFIIAYRMYGPSTQGSSGGSSSGSSSQPGSSQPSANPTSGNQPSSNQPSGSPSSGGQSSSSRTGSSGSTQGSQGGGASGQLTRNNLGNMQNQSSSSRSISSLYELINAKVSIPSSQPNQPAQVYTSPIGDGGSIREYLPLLLDKLTTVRDQELPARVNVMTAPEAVLLALPNLEEADVQAILSSRPSLSSTMSSDLLYQTPAWLMTDANIPVQTMRSLERYITARSQVYRVQSIGHFEGGGPTARIEAVIDVNAGRPRIVYWRDLTELGKVINLQNANAQTPTEN